MVIPLAGRKRPLFLTGTFLLVVVYVALVSKEFAASYFAARPTLPNLQRAVWLSPGDAHYRHRLGRYFAFVAANPQTAVENYLIAARLNPHEARFWFDLASAQRVVGNSDGQRVAIERAVEAEPTAPDVAWEAANFFLVTGDNERAFHEFRAVVDNEPNLSDAAYQTVWRVSPDVDVLLREVVPPRTSSLLSFLNFLTTKKDTEGTIKVWNRIMDLHESFEPRFLFDYVRFLVLNHRPDAASAAWEEASGPLNLSSYLPSADNLIVNGDFNFDILNGGFDWVYVARNGVHLQLDPSDYRQGNRSLSINFEGPGIADAGIGQIIAVHSLTTYEFTAYYKSAEFQGAGGPQLVLRDAYTGALLFASDPLTDADFWKPVHATFSTPPSTNLLSLNVERFPSGSPIRGKLWLDNFSLSPVARDSNDGPKDHL